MSISPDYGSLFSVWETKLADKLVREFRSGWAALQKDDPEDLLQEVLTHWYYKKKEYDPAKEASIKTVLSYLV